MKPISNNPSVANPSAPSTSSSKAAKTSPGVTNADQPAQAEPDSLTAREKLLIEIRKEREAAGEARLKRFMEAVHREDKMEAAPSQDKKETKGKRKPLHKLCPPRASPSSSSEELSIVREPRDLSYYNFPKSGLPDPVSLLPPGQRRKKKLGAKTTPTQKNP